VHKCGTPSHTHQVPMAVKLCLKQEGLGWASVAAYLHLVEHVLCVR